MGTMNILKAGYEKKLGQTYGVAKKGLYDIKAVPFSHTPHNNKQNTAKNEFTGLNRIASRVVKKMWPYLSLNDKNMYRNNALCKAWKNALVGTEFNLNNIKNAIPYKGQLEITLENFDEENLNYTISVKDNNPTQQTEEERIYLAVVTDTQITKNDIVIKGNVGIINSVFDKMDFNSWQPWAFKVIKKNGNWVLDDVCVLPLIGLVIQNGIFYINRWTWQVVPTIEEGIFDISGNESYVENGIFYLK